MSNREPAVPGEYYRCDYCGGSIDRRYYFCVHCGSPWRDPDAAVYGTEPEVEPHLDTRLAREGRPALDFFCILAVSLLVAFVAGWLLGGGEVAAAVLLSDAVVAVVTVVFAVTYRREIAHLFGPPRPSWALLASLPLLGAFLALNYGYSELVENILDLDEDEGFLALIKEDMSPLLLLVSFCIFPAVFEEIGFRGLVQERMVSAGGPLVGFLATSFLFAVLHFTLSAPYIFGLSLFLCWVRAASASLYPVVVLHFLHNFAVVFLFPGG